MESEELWGQLVMQIVIEVLKVNLDKEAALEEEQERFLNGLELEKQKQYDELRMNQLGQVIEDQQLIYERGLLDGLRVAHAAFR